MQQFKNKKYVQIRSGCSSYLSTCCAWTGGGLQNHRLFRGLCFCVLQAGGWM